MVKLSHFAHSYDLKDAVALYHSLRMKPVYLSKEKYESLQTWLASSLSDKLNNIPQEIEREVAELVKYKIITKVENEDEKVLEFIKSKIPNPAINVCYMILSEQCNIACKYCFLGNNNEKKRAHFLTENMSKRTADEALEFFINQIKLSGIDPEENKPVLIFYGGEPLVNFEVLEYISNKVNNLRDIEPYIKNMELSLITNGLLLTRERALTLKKLGVSIGISIDGFTEETNAMRVDKSGNPVYTKLMETLKMCKEEEVPVSLSVTLTEETVKDTKNVLTLVNEYGIKGFGFNIMMSSDTFVLPQSYNEAAAQFIINEFLELRKLGIYEDRIMRKLKSFSKAQVYFSDCAATAGGQIVIAPNGQVGICHGCLHDKKYFVSNIKEKDFDARKNETFIEWSKRTPINNKECEPCPALGICGGGCPINAMYLKEGNTIHSIDERFCVHAKKTLEFLINDLYRVILENKGE